MVRAVLRPHLVHLPSPRQCLCLQCSQRYQDARHSIEGRVRRGVPGTDLRSTSTHT